jgi:Haemolymph juvenile hormone binding protein (JHBP)
VSFDGLFNGNKALTDSTNSFFNENWKDILNEIKPGFSQAIGDVYSSLIDNVFKNIAYEDMFL